MLLFEPPVSADDTQPSLADTRPCAAVTDTEPLYHFADTGNMVDADESLVLVLATDEGGRVVMDTATGWGAGVTVMVTIKRGG